MRVIGGRAKGVRLRGRRTRHLRPTSQMVREALFSILGDGIRDSSFLDLYAGAGTVGIEALSRGAASAVFVENRPELASLIRQNLASAHLTEEATVLCLDGTRAMARLATEQKKFDFVFADPPYYTGGSKVLDAVRAVLSRGGVLICQHSKREEAPSLAGLDQVYQRPFGDTLLTFYRVQGCPSHPSRLAQGEADVQGCLSRDVRSCY